MSVIVRQTPDVRTISVRPCSKPCKKRKACWGFLSGLKTPSEGASTREVGMLSLKLERGLQC